MSKQSREEPIWQQMANLREWLSLPSPLRNDNSGALAILDRIAGRQAELLAEAEAMYDFLSRTNIDKVHPRMRALGAIIAKAKGVQG